MKNSKSREEMIKFCVSKIKAQEKHKKVILHSIELDYLPEILFSLSKVEELYSYLPLKTISKNIKKLQTLRLLYLFDTKITDIPDEIFELKNLKTLSFDGGVNIKKIPDKITNLKKIYNIEFSITSISSVPENISELENLRMLQLFATNLTEIPSPIFLCSELRRLSIYGTKIFLQKEDIEKLSFIENIVIYKSQICEKVNLSSYEHIKIIPEPSL
ncbi:MAG: leucine-rich repeat domain-containing protein [Bernardetiaceae bacterium]|nr:leucine-rich repeat domain-containing protein [Bernardetiaceae bacterium]